MRLTSRRKQIRSKVIFLLASHTEKKEYISSLYSRNLFFFLFCCISDIMKTQEYKRSGSHGISKASTTKDEQNNKNTSANFEQDEIIIDFNIVYPSDCEIKV